MNTKKLLLGFALVALFMWQGCRVDDVEPQLPDADAYSSEVPLAWNTLYLEVERFTPGYRPPVSARTSGYIGLTAYESVVWASATNRSIADRYPGLEIPFPELSQQYDWEAVLNAAYEYAFYAFFPTAPASQQFRIRELAESYHEQFENRNTQAVFNRSVDYGQAVAEAVFEWSATDSEGHEAYLKNADPNYVPPQGFGLWQPTFPDFTPALLPRWGDVRMFAARPNDKVPPPYQVSPNPTSEIYQEALEVRDLVNSIKNGENQDQRWIAEFWSDDCPILTFTPAGRWIAVTNQVIAQEDVPMDYAVLTYAKVGMALADAGIRCWGEKYAYNLERPIDYIRRTLNDPEWNTIMCPDGSGNYFTPNFPAYPSGHATFGAAAATVLTELYGPGYTMTDRCHEGRTEFISTPRSFNSFNEMALENAYSRIPLGVHFRIDAEEGMRLGNLVGYRVNSIEWQN